MSPDISGWVRAGIALTFILMALDWPAPVPLYPLAANELLRTYAVNPSLSETVGDDEIGVILLTLLML